MNGKVVVTLQRTWHVPLTVVRNSRVVDSAWIGRTAQGPSQAVGEEHRGGGRRGQEADTLDITVHRSHVTLGVHLCHFLKIGI